MADKGTGSADVAERPLPRTVTVTGEEGTPWAGWEVTAKADFPARVLIDLQGDDYAAFYAAFDRIVISHNLPDDTGALASSMAEVDPREGAQHMAERVFDAIGALPKR